MPYIHLGILRFGNYIFEGIIIPYLRVWWVGKFFVKANNSQPTIKND